MSDEVLLLGDLHLADRPPSSCTDSYTDDLFEILDAVTDIARERRVRAVIQGGDFFHVKAPSRNSHALVLRSIEWMRSLPCPLLITAGNHDLLQDRYETAHETQPLGLMYAAGAIDLNGWADDLPVFGIPWQQDWEEEGTLERVWRPWRDAARDLDRCLTVTHAPIYPPGRELPYEFIPTQGVSAAMENKGSIFYSHVHDFHGIYTVDDVKYCNNGALSRGSLHESNLTRKILATLWSPDGGFETIDLPHKPGSEVFRLTEHQEMKDSEARLDDFLSSIAQTTVDVASIEAVIASVREQNLDKDVEAIVVSLLEEASS